MPAKTYTKKELPVHGDCVTAPEVDASYKQMCRDRFSNKIVRNDRKKDRDRKALEKRIERTVERITQLRRNHGNRNPPELAELTYELKRLRKQQRKIVAHSGGITHNLFDKLRTFIDYLKSVRDSVGEEILGLVIDIFTTLYNISRNCDWNSIIVNLTSFFSRHFPQKYVDYVLHCFVEVFNLTIAQASSHFDVIGEFFQNMFNMTDNLVNDVLWTKLEMFFLKVATLYASLTKMVSYETLDMNKIYENYKIFRKSLPDVHDIVLTAFQAAEFVFGHWKNILTGDWKVLFFGKDAAKSFETEVRVLENAFVFAISNQEVELQDRYGMTLSQFEARLSDAIKKAEKMAAVCTSMQQKMAISNYVKTLMQKQTDWYARLADAPNREEPYGIKLSGPSSCGKSYISRMLSKIILQAYSEDPNGKGNIVLTNIMEKYESTIKPSHKIIICDDVANSKNEKPNYDRLLNYVNTVPRPLEKADVTEKGKKYPGNVGLLVNTNVDDLASAVHSNCASSILRRFVLHVEINVRPEFQNAYGGLKPLSETRYDVYSLILKRFDHIAEDGSVVWDIIPRDIWNQSGDEDKDFHYLCAFLASDVRKHRIAQANKKNAQEDFENAKFCETCHVPELVCVCRSGESISELTAEIPVIVAHSGCEQSAIDHEGHHSAIVAHSSYDNSRMIEAQFGTHLRALSTTTLWHLRCALNFSSESVVYLHRKVTFWQQLNAHRNLIVLALLFGIAAPWISLLFGRFIGLCAFALSYGGFFALHFHLKRKVEAILRQRMDFLSSTYNDVLEHTRRNLLKYFMFGGAFYIVYSAYKAVRPLFVNEDKSTYFDDFCPVLNKLINKPEKSFIVRTEDERDYKEGYTRLPPEMTKPARCTTADDLKNCIRKHLRVVLVKSKGQLISTVNGLMIGGNLIMVPSHVLPETDCFDIETSASPHVPSAKTKDQKLTKNMVYILPEKDMAIIHLPSAPPAKSFLDFFPEAMPTFRARGTQLIWKSHENDIYESKQPIRPFIDMQGRRRLVYRGMREKKGFMYGNRYAVHDFDIVDPYVCELEFPSFAGLCGGIYMDLTKALIYGFHVAGYADGGKTGWLTTITRPMLKKAIHSLKRTSHCMVVHDEGEVKVNTYGLPYEIVNKPPLYTRDDGAGAASIVTYFGQVEKDGEPLTSRARSPYIRTPFVGIVEEFGEPRHIPPTKPNDVSKSMKTLNKLMDPVQHFEHDLLQRAVNDYQEQTLACVRKNKEKLRDILRIYTQEEAMDGTQDGRLCGLPNSTSAGFPIGKSKKHCMIRDPMDERLVQVPREFNDNFDIQAEIDRTMNAWQDGERSETIYKASSKVNELLPIAKAKDKVRKFYGSSFANFVASRRVLAGVPEFMRLFWRETECLVGTNPMSKEWGDLYEHLTEYGEDTMVAGDFSSYDTRMSAQITTAFGKIILSWFEEMDLAEDELTLIQGALSDIVHPNILFDGDLYRFANSMPSGNLLTVQYNSGANSIKMRYVYYAMNPANKIPFNLNVKLATFGDDNAMGVKKRCKWFNHTTCQEEFDRLAIQYTMADKEKESVPYIPISEVSFLKRRFVVHETLGTIVAPIEHDSITKKFHFVKKPTDSPLTFPDQLSGYIDMSLREAFLHGKEYYIEFEGKVRRILDLNPEVRPFVMILTYGEMGQVMKESYETYDPNARKLFAESIGEDEDEINNLFATPIIDTCDLSEDGSYASVVC